MSKLLKIAIAADALGDDPRQTPRAARGMGFEGMLFDAQSPGVNLTGLSGSGRREFLQLLRSQDQQLVGLRADVGNKGFGPGADVQRGIERLDRLMEAARGLAASLVCVELGPLPEPARQQKPKPKVTAEQAGLILIPSLDAPEKPEPEPAARPVDAAFVARVDEALAEVGRRADRYSVMVAFRSSLASFAALERAVRRAACPWFGIDFDPALALADEWAVDEIFSRLGDLIRHVRGRDAVGGAGGRTRPAIIGQGDVKWDELLASLDAAGYSGWITVDAVDLPNRFAAAEQGLAVLRGKGS